MNIKKWDRDLLAGFLARRGYALTRTSIAGANWKAVLDRALPVSGRVRWWSSTSAPTKVVSLSK